MNMPLTEWARFAGGVMAALAMVALGASVIGDLAPEDRSSGWFAFGTAWATASIAMGVAIRIMDKREPGEQQPAVVWWGVALLLGGIATTLGVRYEAGLLGAGGGLLSTGVIWMAVVTFRAYADSTETQPAADNPEP